jgi:hypothetical protein
MKSRIIAESLMTPGCEIIGKTMIGKEAESEINKVPVSDNSIRQACG